MLSKSKIDIANNLDKLSFAECFRGFVMALSQQNDSQCLSIMKRLPKDQQAQLLRYMNLMMERTILIYAKLLHKANLAIDFYQHVATAFCEGQVEKFDVAAYLENFNYQEQVEARIQEIDSKTDQALNLEQLKELEEGYSDTFDSWMLFAVKFLQKQDRLPKDRYRLMEYLTKVDEMSKDNSSQM